MLTLQYIVEEKYVKANVGHLTTLDNVKNMRQKRQNDTRAQREERDVHGYNCTELVETCKLSSLVVR